jgi:polysaccharide export outer membrane protein
VVELPPLPQPDASQAEERNRRISELAGSIPVEGNDTWRVEEHRLGTNDLVHIDILEAPELNRAVRVSGSGELSIPLLGAVPAAGLTARELELAVEELLRSKYILDPHVTVDVTEIQSHPISVLGSVESPGTFQARGAPTLLEALSMAGGVSPDAGRNVLIIRGRPPAGARADETDESGEGPSSSRVVHWVDLGELLEGGDLSQNVSLGPGDVVKVESGALIYVVGDLNRPGSFPISGSEGMTVLQAVARAEGFTSTAAKGATRIIRTNDQGERLEISVDLGRVLEGDADDVPLRENDIVFVPKSSSRSFVFGLANAIGRMVTLRAIW